MWLVRLCIHHFCLGPAMDMFEPEELQLLICGSPELDFIDLERCKSFFFFVCDSNSIFQQRYMTLAMTRNTLQ